MFLVTKNSADMDGYIIESLVPSASFVSAIIVHEGGASVA